MPGAPRAAIAAVLAAVASGCDPGPPERGRGPADGPPGAGFPGSAERPPVFVEDTGFYQELSWSPDGRTLLLSVLEPRADGEGYSYHVERLAADGSGPARLTEGRLDYWTSWSPEGDRIAFASRREGNTDIWVMRADGTERVRLTDHPASDTQPDWSPSGAEIVFVSDRDGRTRLHLMAADGSGTRPLGEPHGEPQTPAWSPDGGRIVYYATLAGGIDTVYTIRPDGSGRRAVAAGLWPSWSPDGTKVLYGGADGLYLAAADGSGRRRLGGRGGEAGEFSPDGARIAFIAMDEPGGEVAVRVTPADRWEPVTLLRRPKPAW